MRRLGCLLVQKYKRYYTIRPVLLRAFFYELPQSL